MPSLAELYQQPQGIQTPAHLGGHFGHTHQDPGALNWAIIKLGVRSMIDVGCGPGGMVALALGLGIDAHGFDGDPAARSLSSLPPDRMTTHDFCEGPPAWNKPIDLAWSVEFLEHVEEQHAPAYFHLFSQARWVICTAAPPGAYGYHHVTLREESWWIALFGQFGFVYQPKLTRALRAASTMEREFIRRSGLLFTGPSGSH